MKFLESETESTMTHLGEIAVVLGTRPEIIKLAPVIRALGPRARVIHTGQHWDVEMADQFFEDLKIGLPDVRLTSMSGLPRGNQIGAAISELSTHFSEYPPRVVIVQGDTNSTSAGAQAASYSGIPLIHVEAGLRSFDRAMPEELNRLVVCALADLHCAATLENQANLMAEGVSAEVIAVTGNTVVEATLDTLESASGEHQFSGKHQARILVTIHRPENTDTKEALERILKALSEVDAEVVFAVHPRTVAAATQHGLEELLRSFDLRPGLGHSAFLELASQADLIVSDSGGVQEEVTVLKKPLLVVRRSTERPESIRAGFAQLITPEMDLRQAIVEALSNPSLNEKLAQISSPYGDGAAGKQIAELAMRLGSIETLVSGQR